jgi:CMP-N,N'-diacetyllegionaminic acid synthase|tara:strand:+ start:102 stop:797 length:696 start_codon:yes stop_codon:yes gene_type:complete
MKILCTICARKGSKGLKNKNTKLLFGKPLIMHTLKIANQIKFFDKIVVSSDSENILKISKPSSDFVIKRPPRLSSDKISKLDAIKHALKISEKKFNCQFQIVVDLDVCSPLRNATDIQNALKVFKSRNYSNVISVCKSDNNPYFNMVEIDKKKGLKLIKNSKNKYFSRQQSPLVYNVNASIYIWKRKSLIKNKKVINYNTGIYIMPKKRSVDINDPFDFKIAELIKKNGHI